MSETHKVTISVREWDVSARRQLSRTIVSIPDDSPVSVGRVADVEVAVEPLDAGVSRLALKVTWSGGWRLHLANRNGAFVQPWGQAPALVDANTDLDLAWPRVGVRLIGSERSLEHWVLLESTAAAPRDRRTSSEPGPTKLPEFPRPLTPTQMAAVHAVFRDSLAWPPVSGAVPVALAAAAHRLGISPAALQERLSRVQDRAYAVGLHQLVGVSDPGYVHVLVRLGYIQPLSTFGSRSDGSRTGG